MGPRVDMDGDVKDLLLLLGIEPWVIQPVVLFVDRLY